MHDELVRISEQYIELLEILNNGYSIRITPDLIIELKDMIRKIKGELLHER